MQASLAQRIVARANRTAAALMRTRTVPMVNAQPIVSFTFDDFPKSAATTGAAILERRGAAGTFYLSRHFVGRVVDGVVGADPDDVRRLVERGHEIGCHTASHLAAGQVDEAGLRDDIAANAAFLRDLVGDVRMTTFAYPFGDMGPAAKLALQERFAACRSNLAGVNRGVADLGALKAERLYSASRDRAAIETTIAAAARPHSWLIVYTHDVAANPSPYGCTPELLEAAVEAALVAGMRILPVRNALGAIRFRA